MSLRDMVVALLVAADRWEIPPEERAKRAGEEGFAGDDHSSFTRQHAFMLRMKWGSLRSQPS